MTEETRGMQILQLASEISLIDDILEDGYDETLQACFEEEKEIVLSYNGKKRDFLEDRRKTLENQLALI